jgi:hypothetical protein
LEISTTTRSASNLHYWAEKQAGSGERMQDKSRSTEQLDPNASHVILNAESILTYRQDMVQHRPQFLEGRSDTFL